MVRLTYKQNKQDLETLNDTGGGCHMSDRGMKQLSDSLLLQSYHKAIELNLSQDFIDQIKMEIRERSLQHLIKEQASQVS